MTQPRTSRPVLLARVEDRIRQPEPRLPVMDIGWLPTAGTKLGDVPHLPCGFGVNRDNALAEPVKKSAHNVSPTSCGRAAYQPGASSVTSSGVVYESASA